MDVFRPGELWQRLRTVAASARANGHLLPFETSIRIVRDADMDFRIRVVTRPPEKPPASTPSAINPFRPCDRNLVVADVSSSHLAVLNKYSVVDHHLLIVTREFQRQDEALEPSDFAAVARCMVEYDSVAFYNSGALAGASQPHRHLQLIPSTPESGHSLMAIEVKLRLISVPPDNAIQSPELPFEHRLWRMRNSGIRSATSLADACRNAYHALISDLEWSEISAKTPYNLLVTPRWMLIVPRRCELFQGISLNAMAYLGELLVRDSQQLEVLRTAGPMAALCAAAGQLSTD